MTVFPRVGMCYLQAQLEPRILWNHPDRWRRKVTSIMWSLYMSNLTKNLFTTSLWSRVKLKLRSVYLILLLETSETSQPTVMILPAFAKLQGNFTITQLHSTRKVQSNYWSSPLQTWPWKQNKVRKIQSKNSISSKSVPSLLFPTPKFSGTKSIKLSVARPKKTMKMI